MGLHFLFAKNTDWKSHLIDEIKRDIGVNPKSLEETLALKISEDIDLKGRYLGFSMDLMKDVVSFKDMSIGEQAKEIKDYLLEKDLTPAYIQVFSVSNKKGIITEGRCELLYQKVQKVLKKEAKGKQENKEKSFVKVALLPDRSLVLSHVNASETEAYFPLISPFPGGFTTIRDDKAAPSRAFKKLVESQKILKEKIQPGQSVLDLGASPGGWSYVALKAGAKVTSIDRSELRADLMKNPNLNFEAADAFKYESKEIFDWVVSDIICAPPRILELIDQWVKTKRCKNFAFTIKFKGHEDYQILSEFKKRLKGPEYRDYQCLIRQLNVNKNEVMVLGKKRDF